MRRLLHTRTSSMLSLVMSHICRLSRAHTCPYLHECSTYAHVPIRRSRYVDAMLHACVCSSSMFRRMAMPLIPIARLMRRCACACPIPMHISPIPYHMSHMSHAHAHVTCTCTYTCTCHICHTCRYVREEWKRHKSAKPEFLHPFFTQWMQCRRARHANITTRWHVRAHALCMR